MPHRNLDDANLPTKNDQSADRALDHSTTDPMGTTDAQSIMDAASGSTANPQAHSTTNSRADETATGATNPPAPSKPNTSNTIQLSQDGQSATFPNGQVIKAGAGGRLDMDAAGSLTVTRPAKGFEDQSAQDGPIFNITQFSKDGQTQSSAQVQIVYDPSHPGDVSRSTAVVQGQKRDIVLTHEDGTTTVVKTVFQVGTGWVEPGAGELVQSVKAWAESPGLGSSAQPLPVNYLPTTPTTPTTPSTPANFPEGAQYKDHVNQFDLQSDEYVPPNSPSAAAPAPDAVYQALLNAFKNTPSTAATEIDAGTGTQYADAGNTAGNTAGTVTTTDAGNGGGPSTPAYTPTNPPDPTTSYTHYLTTAGASLTPAQQSALTAQLQGLSLGDTSDLSFITVPGGSTVIANADGDIVGEISPGKAGFTRLVSNRIFEDGSFEPVISYINPQGQAQSQTDYQKAADAAQAAQVGSALGLMQSIIGLDNWEHMSDLQRVAAIASIYNAADKLSGNALPGELGTAAAALGLLNALDKGDIGGVAYSGIALGNALSGSGLGASQAIASALGMEAASNLMPGLHLAHTLESGNPKSMLAAASFTPSYGLPKHSANDDLKMTAVWA